MPVVVTTRTFADGLALDAWGILRDIERYPSFMRNVCSVVVRPSTPFRQQSDWVVLFNGNELSWTESNYIDEANLTLHFDQVDGDLAAWRGTMQVFREPVVKAVYTVEFDLGVPSLADLLHPLGERAIRDSCEQMLTAVAQQLLIRAAA